MKDFRQLLVWRKEQAFVLALYRATRAFPPEERFGLTAQIRRAAVSVTSNIAEGCGRDGDAELARFCHIAMGSASEVEYQLLLANDLGFLDPTDYPNLSQQLIEVRRMLNAFLKKLKANS